MLAAFITALAGPELAEREAAVLRAARPCGVILFARNVLDPDQLRRLVEAAGNAIGSQVLVLVDQEGGRVQRLSPPHWRALPAGADYRALYARDPAEACRAARLVAQLTAAELAAVGINCNCAPVLDLPVPGSHAVIGDRAYGTSPDQVAALGRAVAEGLLAGGVVPIIKHVPGHGRACADSHLELPVVDTPRAELEAADFAPFRALAAMPAAMTAHVVFSALDAAEPASTSKRVTADIIRGAIGFEGLLMSDDLGMKALSGSMGARAAAVIAAGSDVALLCSGDLADTESVAAAVPPLQGVALARYQRASAHVAPAQPFDRAAAEAALALVLRVHA